MRETENLLANFGLERQKSEKENATKEKNISDFSIKKPCCIYMLSVSLYQREDRKSCAQSLQPFFLLNFSYFIFYSWYFDSFLYICLIPLDSSLPTDAAVTITAVTCLLVAFIAGILCGALLTVWISWWNKKRRSSEPAPNTQEQQQADVVYEEVDQKRHNIELKQNVAYEPARVT